MDELKQPGWWIKAFRWVWNWPTHPRRIAALEDTVGKLKANAPPAPEDYKLLHGIYWGRPPGASQKWAYCGACAADGRWVPLHRDDRGGGGGLRLGGLVYYRCPTCSGRRPFFQNITLGQEAEGLQS